MQLNAILKLLALLPVAAVAAEQAAKKPVTTGPEVSIAFADTGMIDNFHAENETGVWLQTRDRKWYYAEFFAPCIGIQHAFRLGILPGSTGSLDRWGSVYGGSFGKCQLRSLKASAPPEVALKSRLRLNKGKTADADATDKDPVDKDKDEKIELVPRQP